MSNANETTEGTERDERQRSVAQFAADTFGVAQAESIEQRGLRLLEEAIEAYQAAGCNSEQAHKLVDYIFARPCGELPQELGGVGITLLCLANAAGVSADAMERKEFARIKSKPKAHFEARNKQKCDAGFIASSLVSARSVPSVVPPSHRPFSETLNWHVPANGMPDDGETVLVRIDGGNEPVWLAYFDSEYATWRDVNGIRIEEPIVLWAEMPTGNPLEL